MPPQDAPTTLYLIDGHAQMFRAYHAIRGGMTSPITGEVTNASFAFTGLLLKLLTTYRPTHVAMAIDSKGPTFRHGLYPDYKANRATPPEDFAPQIPTMLEIARLFGIKILESPGHEADDIMATLANRLCPPRVGGDAPCLNIRLVSKDKDLEQVLSEKVTLFDAHTDTELDLTGLMDRRGISPQQVIDYQTLIGDSTDNIPGVKGIGPKTAAKLIQQFGSVAELVERLAELKGKQKENLQAAIDAGDIELTRELVTLKSDVDLPFTLEDAKLGHIDAAALDERFKTLGFNRHRDDLKALVGGMAGASSDDPADDPGSSAGFGLFEAPREAAQRTAVAAAALLDDPLGAVEGAYSAITTRPQLDELVQTLRHVGQFAVDTETIGLGRNVDICGVCLAWETGRAVYIPVCSPQPGSHLVCGEVLDALRPLLEDPAIGKIGHNLKYDWLVLKRAGIEMRGITFDTMIAAFLTGAPGLGMDHLALSELGRTMISITQLIGEKPRRKSDPPQKTMDQIELNLCTAYAAEDADVTLELYERLKPRLQEQGVAALAADVEMPLVEVLATMEAHGIRVDPAELDCQKLALKDRIEALRSEILDAARADFNPDSPRQLGEVLFNQLHFPVQRRTKTGFSTDAEVLEKLTILGDAELEKVPAHARPIPRLIVEYRMLTKLVGTYLVNLADAIESEAAHGDGRIHASFHQSGAATGRLSSSNPNLQNIPIRTDVGRQIRRAFVAEPGHVLVSADYSQIELRMLAHLSHDDALVEAFAAGRDIHRAVAAQVFHIDPDAVTPRQRDHAKVINFGIIYGVTPFGLARRIEGLDLEGAARLISDYKETYPGIDRFLSQCVDQAKREGYVTTILGRRRWIREVTAGNPQQRALGERLAINSVVQGSAADLIKLAMVNLHRRIAREALPCRMLLQIHDELVMECPQPEADRIAAVVIHEMEQAMALRVPLKVESGIAGNWFDAK